GLRVNYLPERRRDFSGPTEAATSWLGAIKRLPSKDKPLATLMALIAVVLASARKVRATSFPGWASRGDGSTDFTGSVNEGCEQVPSLPSFHQWLVVTPFLSSVNNASSAPR